MDKGKTIKKFATGLLIISLALTAAGCNSVIQALTDPAQDISTTAAATELPTKTMAPTPTVTVTPTITPTETPTIIPTPDYIPLHSSLEIEGDVDGIPVKINFAIGQDVYEREELPLDKWIINPEAQEFLAPNSVEDALAKIFLKAHFFAWQGDDYENRKPVTFEEYIQRLKDGEDMSYEIAAIVPGSVLQTTVKKVSPLRPVTIVLVNKVGGYSGGISARDLGTYNYVDNGTLRIENYVSLEYLMSTTGGENFFKDDPRIADGYMFYIASSLQSLSMDIEYQKPDVYRSKISEYSSRFFKERPEVNQLINDLWLNTTGGTGRDAYTNLLLIKQ